MPTELNTELSPSLYPDSVVDGAPAVPAVEEIRLTLASAYAALGRFHKASVSVERDPTLNEYAKIHEGEQLRQKSVEKISPMFDRACRLSNVALEAAETRLREAAKPDTHTAAAKEIRAHVKSLPREARLGFLQSAARRGDRETVHAIVSTLPYLSGLDFLNEEQFDAMKSDAYRKISPELADDVDRLRTVEERLMGALSAYHRRYHKVDPRAAGIANHVNARVAARS